MNKKSKQFKKDNLLNLIYRGSSEDMDISLAEEYYTNAKGKYEDILSKFEEYYKLYTEETNTEKYDKNIVFELIETEIDNNMYLPKAKSLNGKVESAIALEDILKNELMTAKYKEYNDLQERLTYIFGVSITHIYWDRLSRNSALGGKLNYKVLDPRCFIPQPGIKEIQDMDYCFIVETTTKLRLMNEFLLSDTDLELLNGKDIVNIDTDLVVVKTMYYKDKFNHICKFSWCGDKILDNINDIYSDKAYYCKECNTIKTADEDICSKCNSSKFELKSVERNKIKIDTESIDKNGIQTKKSKTINVTPYVPNKFPIVIRKNISVLDLYGISDVKMIKNNQKLYNHIMNKSAERILKSGSIVALPKTMKTKFKVDNSELKLLWYDNPAEANGIIVKSIQPSLGNEPYIMDTAYNTARQTLGITNSFQGREDNSAISSKSKEVQIAQTAGRLESKREMKKAGLINLFEIMFEFILAYADQYHGYYKNIEGNEVYKVYDNRLFLISDGKNYIYDDEFIFDIDLSASLENNRELMWQETRLNFSSGSYGDPTDLNTIKMFWTTMRRLNYPGAKEALEYIDSRIKQQLIQQEIEQTYRNRELQLQSSQLQSQDMMNDRETQAKANQANANILKALNNE